jgi:hypothetical protein
MTTTEQSFATSSALIDTLKRYSASAGFIGLIGIIATIAGIFLPGGGSNMFLRAWLTGTWMWFGAGAGCLLILMTQYLTGGAWGIVIRRPLEAGAKTLYLWVLLFLPLLIFHDGMYWWSTPEGLADKVIKAKHLYLNIPFWWVRWVICSLFLVGFTRLLTVWSLREDETKSMEISSRLEKLSGPGVPLYFLLMTFLAIDFLMTLEPYWFSTMYGFIIVMGQCLTAMCICVAVLCLTAQFAPMDHAVTKRHLLDLGKLMLALVMLWAYTNFGQLLITWSGNLPAEIIWYIKRWNGGWGWIAVLMLVGHFCLPFLLLLSQDLKRNPKTISAIAIYIVVVHAIDVLYLVEPNFPTFPKPVRAEFSMSWLDITSLVGFGGLWFALFFRNLPAAPLLPLGAPDLKKALSHGSH